MANTTAPRRVEQPDHVLVQHLPDDESVFLDLNTERYFGLDATGTAMWKALMHTGSVDDAASRLLQEFDVDQETLRRDLFRFIDDLRKRDLLRVDTDPTGTTSKADRG